MDKDKKIKILAISIISAIIVSLIIVFSIPEITIFPNPLGNHLCPKMVPNYILWISNILMIIIIIPISYYFISRRLEKKLEKNIEVLFKLIKKQNNSVNSKTKIENGDTNLILRFLNPNERKVVEKLIENKGNAFQSEITRMQGMTKLKTHRAVKELELKGIIKIQKDGMTNKITLSDDVKELF
jgi:predicted transcriptional regulator